MLAEEAVDYVDLTTRLPGVDTESVEASELVKKLSDRQLIGVLLEQALEQGGVDYFDRAKALWPLDTKAIAKKVKADYQEEKRLPDNNEEFEVDAEFLKKVEESFASLKTGTIKSAFAFHRRLWIAVDGLYKDPEDEGDLQEAWAVQLVQEEDYDIQKAINCGAKEGATVRWNKASYVMTGPKITFKRKTEAKPAKAAKSAKKGGRK
jgi:hypothetical protein